MPRAPKSRNGCITCRRKRLKCDEAKPSCERCTNSRTTCEGYRKRDLQWRFVEQPLAKSPSARCSSSDGSALHSAFEELQGTPSDEEHRVSYTFATPSITETLDNFVAEGLSTFSPGTEDTSTVSESARMPRLHSPTGPQSESASAFAVDYLYALSGANIPDTGAQYITGEQVDEDTSVPMLPTTQHWEDSSGMEELAIYEQLLGPSLLVEPSLDVSSPGALMLRYNRDTCGILSLKDGPSENPWRTLIGPLSSSSVAVRCALLSMAASHGSYDNPSLRLSSISGRSQSIKALLTEIDNFRLVPALATSLVLAFSEGWEEPINCTQHLRGARGLVWDFMQDSSAVAKLQDRTTDLKALRYLCNTFVYIDVISRLTSLEDDSNTNYEAIVSATNFPTRGLMEVDPLLGCASSLFPIIARVANTVQKVRKGSSISLTLIGEAGQLQEQLHQWALPSPAVFQTFEDSTSQVRHAVITADALRYAALLYLHQAIPEMLSEPDAAKSLARKVLVRLATVPSTSRALNTHIFPLLIASCEVTDREDRDWVKDRWLSMAARLKVRNVDCCWRIVQEVWDRRDLQRGDCPSGCSHALGFEYKVGCKLHWLGVMLDMQWEVFAG